MSYAFFTPKKKSTSPLPDDSLGSGNRLCLFKEKQQVIRQAKGVKPKRGARTPRNYVVVNRKRPASLTLSRRTIARRNRRQPGEVEADTHPEPLANVFGRDGDPNLDSD